MRRVLSLVTVGLCLAAPAGAQPLGAASVEDYWLSVGGGGGVIVTPGGEFVEAAPTVLARVNVSSRLAVELALDFLALLEPVRRLPPAGALRAGTAWPKGHAVCDRWDAWILREPPRTRTPPGLRHR